MSASQWIGDDRPVMWLGRNRGPEHRETYAAPVEKEEKTDDCEWLEQWFPEQQYRKRLRNPTFARK
ncbi:MAG: hypothetical protein ACOC6F_03460 [bacterium]